MILNLIIIFFIFLLVRKLLVKFFSKEVKKLLKL